MTLTDLISGGLVIAALIGYLIILIDALRTPAARYSEVGLSKWIWLAVIIVLSGVGAALYLAVVRPKLRTAMVAEPRSAPSPPEGSALIAITLFLCCAALLFCAGLVMDGRVVPGVIVGIVSSIVAASVLLLSKRRPI
jgi:hypothetical protein